MRILLINKFYYRRGGDCIYTIELEKLLKANGHSVAVFSQQFKDNLPHANADSWPSEVDYSSRRLSNLKEAVLRPLYSTEVRKKFLQLLQDFKPDVVHVNNIHSQISPLVVQLAYQNKIPVVWTLHDYKLLCPAYSCFRSGDVCELCFTDKKHVIRHRCVKNKFASFIAYAEAIRWSAQKLEQMTSKFIAPSTFMKYKMVQGGFSECKFEVLHNFINDTEFSTDIKLKENYYCFVGRFSHEKGIKTLLHAASNLTFHLKLIGHGPLLKNLRRKFQQPNIEFCGYMEWDTLKDLIQRAKFLVIPSEWYENNPLTIIEAMALGTPVLGAAIGGIPELIEEDRTGLTFEPRNVDDLKQKITRLFNELDTEELGLNARKLAQAAFGAHAYYQKLITIYREVMHVQ